MRGLVLCSTCKMPGRLIFNDEGELEEAIFVCKCPRPTVEEVNKQIHDGGS